jgi:hypothetical protein
MAYGKIIPFIAAATSDATERAVAIVNADAAPQRVNLEHQLQQIRDEVDKVNAAVWELDQALQKLRAESSQRAHDRLRRQQRIDQIRAEREQKG